MAALEKRPFAPYVIILALLLMTSAALAFTTGVRVASEAGVDIRLPARVGSWQGTDLVFCQTPSCQRRYLRNEVDMEAGCPACGGALDTASMAERRMLPADTVLLKKIYTNEVGNTIYASLVLSGKERGSIHRPEVCLRGQGRRVERSSTLQVPLGGEEHLEVKVLDLLDATRYPDGRPGPDLQSYYAYWFVGKGRQTSSHWKRIFWMGFDRVFHNVAHRWAYIAVGGGRNPGSEAHREELETFLKDFYPKMELR